MIENVRREKDCKPHFCRIKWKQLMFTHTHLHKPCENKSFSLNLCWMLFSRLLLFLHLFSLNFLCKQLDFIKITLRTLVLMQYFECVSFFAGWMASFCCFFWWNESEIILWMVFSVCYSFFSLTKRHLLFFSISSNDVTLMHNVSGSVCCFVVCLVFNIILFVWFSFFFFFFLICFFFHLTFLSHHIFSARLWWLEEYFSFLHTLALPMYTI